MVSECELICLRVSLKAASIKLSIITCYLLFVNQNYEPNFSCQMEKRVGIPMNGCVVGLSTVTLCNLSYLTYIIFVSISLPSGMVLNGYVILTESQDLHKSDKQKTPVTQVVSYIL